MPDLTSLEQVDGIDAALRKKLELYWITSAEELVSTAKASNQQYGNGRAALAVALGMSEEAVRSIVNAANAILPADTSFAVPVEQELGDGLIIDQYVDVEATSFAVPTDLPPQVEPLFPLPKPHNQGVRNSCVAFTLAAIYQILSKDPTDISEQFLYWACKSRDNIRGDVGTDPLVAVRVLQEMGICAEAIWPYKPNPRDDQNPGHGPPPPAALDDARLRRITGFQPLPSKGFLQIKGALAAGMPVLIGLPIWEHWQGSWQGSTLGRLRNPLPGERRKGGHAMCVVGYRDDEKAPGRGYFIVRNSWGPDWAKDNSDGSGYCHVPYRVVAESGLAAIAIEGVVAAPAPPPVVSSGATPAPTPSPATSGSTTRPSPAEGVANAPAPSAVTSGRTTRGTRRVRPRGSLGGSGEEGAEVDLTKVYAEVAAIRDQLDQLITGAIQDLRDRLDDLAAALGEVADPDAVAPGSANPPTPEASVAPESERARRPVAVMLDTAGVSSGPLILISDKAGPEGEELYPNGVAPDGKPLLRIDAATASLLARGKFNAEPKERIDIYKAKRTASSTGHLGTVADVAQGKIEEARWAVIVNATEDAALIKAAWPLIAHRMRQMGQTPPAVTWNEGENAAIWLSRHTDNFTKTLKSPWGQTLPVMLYRPGERVNGWLARHGVAQGPVDPRRGVPFYLMILGRPGPLNPDDATFVPLNFQYELDIFWGVGRLCFTDHEGQHRLGDYTTYAERLVGFEQRQDAAAQLRKEIVYFATKHDMDNSTQRSAEELVRPLSEWSLNAANIPVKHGFAHQLLIEQAATRSAFEQIVRGGVDGKPPALLFTASHGLGLPLSDDRLMKHQGALVLQDWDGTGSVRREHWFAGEDLAGLTGGPKLEGTMAFLFACYGAGCPDKDEFIFDEQKGRPQIAHFAMIAQLPQQLLVNGALGVIGHVERAWTFSFSGTEGAKAQSQPFEDVLGRLMQGRRAGDATDQFNIIQGARAMTLTEELENIKFGKIVNPLELSKLWMARNDARNYALLGDPAARLPY